MVAGTAAYEGITFTSAAKDEDPLNPGDADRETIRILITLPGGTRAYKLAHQARNEQQMKNAALRLAQLLSVIKFK
jgi:hypothetical protein